MDGSRRIARSRIFLSSIAAAILGGLPGCSTFALEPSDFLPSAETWEKLSPTNWWYDLQPSRLQRLNENPSGMSSDVYYSVSDPLPPDTDSDTVVIPTEDAGSGGAAVHEPPSIVRR